MAVLRQRAREARRLGGHTHRWPGVRGGQVDRGVGSGVRCLEELGGGVALSLYDVDDYFTSENMIWTLIALFLRENGCLGLFLINFGSLCPSTPLQHISTFIHRFDLKQLFVGKYHY